MTDLYNRFMIRPFLMATVDYQRLPNFEKAPVSFDLNFWVNFPGISSITGTGSTLATEEILSSPLCHVLNLGLQSCSPHVINVNVYKCSPVITAPPQFRQVFTLFHWLNHHWIIHWINGNSRILKWRYCTIQGHILWWYSLTWALYRPYIW